MNQEYKETNGSRNGGVNTENLMIDHGPLFPSRRTDFKETRIGRGCRMKSPSRWTITIRRRSIESSSSILIERSLIEG